jgi:putative transposase
VVSHQKAIFLLIPRSLLRGVFIFRDAKQYWGLEDFMNVTPTGVTNAANLSLFMVNVSYRLRADVHPCDPAYSVLDLKADCRGSKYVEETIQMLPEKPEPILSTRLKVF